MSTVHEPKISTPENDPFFYGWRDVLREDEHGQQQLDRIPLTLHDVLHPQEGDHIMQGAVHIDTCFYLHAALRMQAAHRPDVRVFSDFGIVWPEPELAGGHCPDVTVVVGPLRERDHAIGELWSVFNVQEEGLRPELLLEVTSRSTRAIDLGRKMHDYFLAKVPYYVIVDNESVTRRRQPTRFRLLGYRRGRRAFQPLRLNKQGRLWLECVETWLGIEDETIVCYTREGEPIRDLTAETQARREAEQALSKADQARLVAEARVLELEAELKRLRGEK